MFAVLIIMKRNTAQHDPIQPKHSQKRPDHTAEPHSIIIDGDIIVVAVAVVEFILFFFEEKKI